MTDLSDSLAALSEGVDLGLLGWVKGEIDLAMRQGREALEQAAADNTDQAAIGRSIAHLHQAHGALSVVGLSAVPAVTKALEDLLQALADREPMRLPDYYSLGMRGFDQLQAYLHALTAGVAHQPMQLSGLLQALQHAAGITTSDPLALFHPDLQALNQVYLANLKPAPAVTTPQTLRQLRGRFQALQLRWMRTSDQAAEPSSELVSLLAELELADAPQALLWWLVGAMLELLPTTPVVSFDVRLLLNRVEQHLGRRISGDSALPESLMRELLYAIGMTDVQTVPGVAVSPRVQQLRHLLRPLLLPGEGAATDAALSAGNENPLLPQIRDQLTAAITAWSNYTASSADTDLQNFLQGIQALSGLAGPVAQANVAALATDIAALGHWLMSASGNMSETIGLEVATALLLLQQWADLPPAVDQNLTRELALMRERLAQARHGQLLRTAPSAPLLRDVSRQAQEKLLLTQVVTEIQTNLRLIETVLEQFFRDPAKREHLSALQLPLTQVLGALEMLDQPHARQTMLDCAKEFQRFAMPDYQPQTVDFEALAAALSSLGFYVEQLVHGKPEIVLASRAVMANESVIAKAPSTAMPVLVEDAENPASVITNIAPAVTLADPAATQAPLEAESTANLAELGAVYAEEVEQVRARLQRVTQHLQQQDDMAVVDEVRCDMHGLKGAARMLGLNDAGDVFAAMEQLLSAYPDSPLHSRPSPDQALCQLLLSVQTYLVDLLHSLRGADTVSSNGSNTQPLLEQVSVLMRRAGSVTATGTGYSLDRGLDRNLGRGTGESEAVAGTGVAATVSAVMDVSQTVRSYFTAEARSHLQVLQLQVETLLAHGVLSTEFSRAVHTLRGIAATVNHQPMTQLAQAMETLVRRAGTTSLPVEQRDLVLESLRVLATLVDSGMASRDAVLPDTLIVQLTTASALHGDNKEQQRRTSMTALDPMTDAGDMLQDELDIELLPLFLQEATEKLALIGELMRRWRGEPDNPAFGGALKRELHTVKGSARMAGAMRLGERVHQMESLIDEAQTHTAIRPTVLDELEQRFDAVLSLHEALEIPIATQPDIAAATDATIAVGAGKSGAAMPAPGAAASSPLRVQTAVIDRLVNDAGELAISRSRIAMEINALRLGMQELSDNLERLRQQLREIDIQAETKLQSRRMESSSAAHTFDPLEFDRFTRLQELTRLMNESVEDIGAVRQTLSQAIDQTQQALDQQTRLTRVMQQGLMQVRMLQVGSIAGRLHRVVRQTAKEQGKSVNLEILGAAVQLDRSVLERITAPFEHLLRNAVVHGIELPARRAAAGKTATGEITISVINTPNEVQVLVSDDGAGLDLQALRQRAVSEGRIPVDQDLTDSELGKLIFLPGLSTAAALTQAAGRGVGLDVVRNEVEALGGRITVASEPGQGARFSIGLPLTLSLIQAVLVRAGGLLYAIPTMMVEHIRHIPQADMQAARSAKKLAWQGRQLAYAALNSLLGWNGMAAARSTAAVSTDAGLHAKPQLDLRTDSQRISVLFLRSADQTLALEVEQMLGGSQEIVIKPIGPPLTRRAGISAATVMGSGEIGLIINPLLLLQGHEVVEHSRRAAEPAASPDCVVEADTETVSSGLPTIMIVDDSLTVRRITSRLLTREGYKVIEARDGMEALNTLQGVRELALGSMPVLLLVDIEMPRMDGFEFTSAVRADPYLSHLPIIMISSRTAEKHRSHALQLGVNAFLGKPYQEQELLGHISALAFTRP